MSHKQSTLEILIFTSSQESDYGTLTIVTLWFVTDVTMETSQSLD